MAYNQNKKTKRKNLDENVQSELGRSQPQAVDFEAAVIGACLIEQDAFGRVTDILTPESFYDPKHRIIFAAISSLIAENNPVDILTVTEKLRANGELDDAGGQMYISELSLKVLSSAHLEYHAKIIADKSLARQLISLSNDTLREAYEDSDDIQDLLDRVEGGIFELTRTHAKKDFTQINPVLKEAYSMLLKARSKSGGITGVASGFDDLDKITNGWQNSDLIIIAARPAMGKTAFVLSMAKNITVNMGIPVAVFSLEMSNVQLVNRLIINVSEIEGTKIKSGQLEKWEMGIVDTKINELRDAPLYIDDTPSLSVFELRTKARRLVNEHNVKLIIIDYLQLMNASGMRFNSRQEEVSVISRSLKGLAKELNIPIIALSQLNRQVEGRVAQKDTELDSKRPQLSDLRESGAIEQDADMVIFIHRPEYYKIYNDSSGKSLRGLAEIIIAKHRNGATDDVWLKFEGSYARFSNSQDTEPPFPDLDDLGIESRINK